MTTQRRGREKRGPPAKGRRQKSLTCRVRGASFVVLSGAKVAQSVERTAALEGWLWRYNFKRPRGSLGRRPPAARLAELNNALGSYS